MKKIYFLLFLLLPLSAVSQVEDSLIQVIKEQGLNLLVAEPGEDPNGAQSRPCGTSVVNVSGCCYVYQVICSGEVKWQSEVFCTPGCSYFTSPSFILPKLGMVIPTSTNPTTTNIPFDMSILVDTELFTEGELLELWSKYHNFYFEVEDDILIDNGEFYLLFKAGNYKINQGEMPVKVYFTTY